MGYDCERLWYLQITNSRLSWHGILKPSCFIKIWKPVEDNTPSGKWLTRVACLQTQLLFISRRVESNGNFNVRPQVGSAHQRAKDFFKEVWVGAVFFWKMVDMLSKGILSTFKNQNGSRFRRESAANFASNSRLVGVKVKERIHVLGYLLWGILSSIFFFVSYLHLVSWISLILITYDVTDSFPLFHYSWISRSKICYTTARKSGCNQGRCMWIEFPHSRHLPFSR